MTPETCRCFSLIVAAQARIEGMRAENTARQQRGESMAYDDKAFFVEAMENELAALQSTCQRRAAEAHAEYEQVSGSALSIRMYGRHTETCAWQVLKPCTCGYDKADLELYKAAKQPLYRRKLKGE